MSVISFTAKFVLGEYTCIVWGCVGDENTDGCPRSGSIILRQEDPWPELDTLLGQSARLDTKTVGQHGNPAGQVPCAVSFPIMIKKHEICTERLDAPYDKTSRTEQVLVIDWERVPVLAEVGSALL